PDPAPPPSGAVASLHRTEPDPAPPPSGAVSILSEPDPAPPPSGAADLWFGSRRRSSDPLSSISVFVDLCFCELCITPLAHTGGDGGKLGFGAVDCVMLDGALCTSHWRKVLMGCFSIDTWSNATVMWRRPNTGLAQISDQLVNEPNIMQLLAVTFVC
ncbi:hypothetical protein U1Q18_010235, partial [Sarracenia purpurea var. burkii]